MSNYNCSKCKKTPCGCAQPTYSIEDVPESFSMLKHNMNGVSVWYDYQNMIDKSQTDTKIETIPRGLKYSAERHTDTITASQLGSILHLADIDDVDTSEASNNSLLVFDGETNAWSTWNSTDNGSMSMQTAMGFDADGKPKSLSSPTNANEYHMLGWNAGEKLGYIQPTQFSNLSNKVPLYMDKTTKQIGWYQS